VLGVFLFSWSGRDWVGGYLCLLGVIVGLRWTGKALGLLLARTRIC
jgi:hypothetical protein